MRIREMEMNMMAVAMLDMMELRSAEPIMKPYISLLELPLEMSTSQAMNLVGKVEFSMDAVRAKVASTKKKAEPPKLGQSSPRVMMLK